MRRRGWLLASAVVAVVALGFVFVSSEDSPTDGPIDAGRPGGVGQVLDPGEAYTAGHVLLGNLGDEPAVVERVRLVGVKGPIQFLGVRTRPVPGTDADGIFAGIKGFPPDGFVTRPLAEQNVVPVPTEFTEAGGPLQNLELALGVRSTGAGVGRAWGVEVTYRVDDTRYVERIKARIYLCAPAADFRADIDGTCPGKFQDDFSDEVTEAPE